MDPVALLAGLAARLFDRTKERIEEAGDLVTEELEPRLREVAETTAQLALAELAGSETGVVRSILDARLQALEAVAAIHAADAVRDSLSDLVGDLVGTVFGSP